MYKVSEKPLNTGFFAFLWYNNGMVKETEIRDNLAKLNHDELLAYAIKAEIDRQTLMEQLMTMRNRKYGHSSEKVSPDQLSLFNEAETILDEASKEEIIEESEKTSEERKKKVRAKKGKETDYEGHVTKTVHHTLEKPVCDECGSPMKEIGADYFYELRHIPARLDVIRHVVHKYKCTNEEYHDCKAKIVSGDTSDFHRLIDGSVVSPSLAAGIAVNKFVYDVPLYRQEQEYKRQGLPVTRQNMSNWLIQSSERYLEPVFNAMVQDLRGLTYRHMDETTLVVLENKESREKSYEWLAMSGKSEEKQMALYFYNESHKHSMVDEILGPDARGYVQSDGYEAYHNRTFTNVGCWAHVRRKFVDALQNDSEKMWNRYQKASKEEKRQMIEENEALAHKLKILSLIKRMFELDQKAEDRKKMKQEKMPALFDEFFECIKQLNGTYPEKSNMGKAITYALNQEEWLRNYLADENLELSNNRGERSIKPFVMARKNFLFSKTERGAKHSSIWFSMIESAKMNGLDPFKYMTYVLEKLSKEGVNDTVIQEILPYSKQLPKELYSKSKSKASQPLYQQ